MDWCVGRPSIGADRAGTRIGLPAYLTNASILDVRPMFRPLMMLAFALCVLPRNATASDISSRHRCVCSTSWHRHTAIVRYRHYRVRTAYLIGYDPLPYRYGSTYVFERPYRYIRR